VTNQKIKGAKLSRKQHFSGDKIIKGYTILFGNFERRGFVKTGRTRKGNTNVRSLSGLHWLRRKFGGDLW